MQLCFFGLFFDTTGAWRPLNTSALGCWLPEFCSTRCSGGEDEDEQTSRGRRSRGFHALGSGGVPGSVATEPLPADQGRAHSLCPREAVPQGRSGRVQRDGQERAAQERRGQNDGAVVKTRPFRRLPSEDGGARFKPDGYYQASQLQPKVETEASPKLRHCGDVLPSERDVRLARIEPTPGGFPMKT